MSASIHLDRPQPHYTNLDYITGKVQVHLSTETAIGGIQVKLEGESRTRLSGPRYPGQDLSVSDKRRTELEVHKVRSPGDVQYASAASLTPDRYCIKSPLFFPLQV